MDLHPFRQIQNPGVGGKKLKLDNRDLALTGIITALCVTVNVTQTVTAGNPTIYGPIQLRVADCLLVLTAILGTPVIFGAVIGCFLTNAYYFIGITDVIFGPIANLIAATTIYLLREPG